MSLVVSETRHHVSVWNSGKMGFHARDYTGVFVFSFSPDICNWQRGGWIFPFLLFSSLYWDFLCGLLSTLVYIRYFDCNFFIFILDVQVCVVCLLTHDDARPFKVTQRLPGKSPGHNTRCQ